MDYKPSVCGVFGPTKDLTSDDTALHENCFDYLKSVLKFAAVLGVNFVAGPMYSAVGKARYGFQEQRKVEWDRAVTNLRKVCEYWHGSMDSDSYRFGTIESL